MNLVQNYLTRNPCYKNNVNKADSRYTTFQQRGPLGLMLHSVGCAQPNASVFLNSWNQESYDYSCVHGVIDANTGTIYQCLPWNFRGWHGGGSSNNTHVGVEMCESSYIRYMTVGESGYAPGKFVVKDAAKAKADCKRAYDAAVELYAMLCAEWNLNPMTDIVSHKEGGQQGIASGHGDPEHYWDGLGIGYTMNGFRAAVKAKMEEKENPGMTDQQIQDYINSQISIRVGEVKLAMEAKFREISKTLSDAYGNELTFALVSLTDSVDQKVTERIGKEIGHLKDIPGKGVQKEFSPLLEAGFIDGGTPKEQDDTDIRLPWSVVRALIVAKRYTDAKLAEFLVEDAENYDCGDSCKISFFDEESDGEAE